ncbi:MAG: hypothetical protein ACFFC7_29210 [Candidatus Hermodarchaeota archaeon]
MDFRLNGSRRSPYNDNGKRALLCCESGKHLPGINSRQAGRAPTLGMTVKTVTFFLKTGLLQCKFTKDKRARHHGFVA